MDSSGGSGLTDRFAPTYTASAAVITTLGEVGTGRSSGAVPIATKAAWAHGAGVASSIPRGSQQHRLGDGDATCRDGSRRWKWTRVRHDQSANRRRWTMYRRGIVGGRNAGLRGTRTDVLSVGGTEEAIRHRNHIDRMGKDLDWEGKRMRWENGEKVSMEGTDISIGKDKKGDGIEEACRLGRRVRRRFQEARTHARLRPGFERIRVRLRGWWRSNRSRLAWDCTSLSVFVDGRRFASYAIPARRRPRHPWIPCVVPRSLPMDGASQVAHSHVWLVQRRAPPHEDDGSRRPFRSHGYRIDNQVNIRYTVTDIVHIRVGRPIDVFFEGIDHVSISFGWEGWRGAMAS